MKNQSQWRIRMAVNMAKLKVFEQIKILFPHCEIVRYAQSSTFLSSIKSGPGKSLRPGPIANAHACSPARISISWLLAKPVVTSVIIGAKRPDQLEENLAAVEVQLTEDELKLLDQVSALRPNIPVGCSPLTAPAV